MASEAAPLLPHAHAVPLGTERFPFHPCATSTPLWRKLLAQFFDGCDDVAMLEEDDVWPLEQQLRGPRPAQELASAIPSSGRWKLLRGLWKSVRNRLAWVSLWTALSTACAAVRPLLLLYLFEVGLSKLQPSTTPQRYGLERDILLPLCGIFLAEMVGSFLRVRRRSVVARMALFVTQSLSATLTKRVAIPTTRTTAFPGQKQRLADIAAILTNDLGTIGYSAVHVNDIVSRFVRLGVSISVLVRVVPIPEFTVWLGIGAYVVALVLGLTTGISFVGAKVEDLLLTQLDAVVECVKSIQMVKISAWEGRMQQQIETARSNVLKALSRPQMISVALDQLVNESPRLLATLIFAVLASGMVGTDNDFTETVPRRLAQVLVTLILLSDCLRYTEESLDGARAVLAAYHAWRRIDSVLVGEVEEVKTEKVVQPSARHSDATQIIAEMEGVCVYGASQATSPAALLVNVNWTLRCGELVVIHGPAGAGKSTLLAALRSDDSAARVLRGYFHAIPSGIRVAYCSQDPWLQTLSIRENILFGTDFDELKYWSVLDACGLLEDLCSLPQGDATPIGPRGINLSSGQTARIALARSCYADADVYLLDCPLANVDAVVQSEIFRKCILELLMFKTVVIVTHNPEYIQSEYVDQLVEVQSYGTRVTDRPPLCDRRTNSYTVNRRMRDHRNTVGKLCTSDRSLNLNPLARDSRTFIDRIQAKLSSSSVPQQRLVFQSLAEVSVDTIRKYVASSGAPGVAWLVGASSISLLWAGVFVAKDVWIVDWAAMTLSSSETGVLVYGGLVLASALVSFIARACVFEFNARSAAQLFRRMTYAVINAPMTYFYKTPIGEAVGRFFSDMEYLDDRVPRLVSLFMLNAMVFVARAGVFGVILGPAGLAVALIGPLLLIKSTAASFRVHLTRLNTLAGTKRLSFLSEILDGSAVIRAFGQSRLESILRDLQQANEASVRADFMGSTLRSHAILKSELGVLAVIFGLVATLALCPVTIAELILALLYIITMQQELLSELVRRYVNTYDQFYHVERVQEIARLASEQETNETQSISLLNSWPQHGKIEFECVIFAYSDDKNQRRNASLQWALLDVSFCIEGGENIGVVGRTGSGKSSLAMALLRVHPLRSGRILIDGVDIRQVPLSRLRQSFTIIPQSPTFYRCSVRDYMDPFREFEDARLWKELLSVDLGHRVQSLDDELLDNGENWSQGQRQLLCFARALLKPSRVVILDEAFSCIDQQCQGKILGIVRERFVGSTVVLITHRLDQILGFDRILVMRGGRLVESGSAEELASNPGGEFYEFLETSLLTL